METQTTCPKCGAHNAPDAEWCSQCFESLLPDEPDPEPAGEEHRYAHPTEYVSPAGKPIYSRWAGTETSFGPFGRILMTLLVVAVGVGLSFNFSPVPLAIWVFLAMPVLLRSIWKRVAVRYERSEPRPVVPRAALEEEATE